MRRIAVGFFGRDRDKAKVGSPPKIVVVSELFRPELTSTGYYVTKIAERLAHTYDVEVICGQPTYAERGRRAPKSETVGRCRITRVPSTTLDKNKLGFRLLNVVTLTLSLVYRATLSIRRNDVVIVVTNPPTLPLVMTLICRARGALLAALVHDRFPEVMVAVGFRSERSATVRVLKIVNQRLFPLAAAVVVVGRDMEREISKQIPLARVKVLSNWAENHDVRPLPTSERDLRDRLGIPPRGVVLYAGNFGRANDLETLIDAAELLRGGGITFVLIGHGVKRPDIEASIAERGLGHVVVHGPYPRTEQCQLLACGDVIVIPSVARMSGISVPSRIYNSLAAGRPVIVATEETAEIAQIVREHEVGWVVEPGSAEKLAQAIRTAFDEQSAGEVLAMSERAVAVAQGELSEDALLQGWERLVDELWTDNKYA